MNDGIDRVTCERREALSQILKDVHNRVVSAPDPVDAGGALNQSATYRVFSSGEARVESGRDNASSE